MRRSQETELLDAAGVSEETVARSYRELQWVNRWLGNTGLVLQMLRTRQASDLPLSVLDIGCGHGGLLAEIREKTGARVIGFDVRAAPCGGLVPIVAGNAVTDPLPEADVAVCVFMAHHLDETEVVELIRNVSRSCRRLILLDLVRHWMPLLLFSAFVAPVLGKMNAADGKTSIRRAFTAKEMRSIVDRALAGGRTVKSMRHTVAPFWVRQVVDVEWKDREQG